MSDAVDRIRTVGVEEELLLVEPDSGRPRAVAAAVLSRAAQDPSIPTDGSEVGGSLEAELQQQQVETDTRPCTDLADLAAELRAWRRHADRAARQAGARVAALATSPLPAPPKLTPNARYRAIVERFGLTAAEQLTCGCHVHVAVGSEEEGVAVLDRIRIWLPALLACSANSPFWQGEDTGYASFRSQAWSRWPVAGPTDAFGSAERYRAYVADLLRSQTVVDAGMLYFDARLSTRYATVEIRAADVCLDVADTVLVAALCRALVETAARDWRSGRPAPQAPAGLIRLAMWRAGRSGTTGDLVDPRDARALPAREVLSGLLDHVRAALRASGDLELVEARLATLLADGSGADRQRRVFAETGDLGAVVADAVRATLETA